MPELVPVTKGISLATQAYDHIRAAIVAGDLAPGPLYSVNQLAFLLGISRTPVREALLALAGQGLLRIDRNRGFRVTNVTKRDLDEIIDLRMLLEVPAMERLAAMRPAPSIAKIAFRQARAIYPELQRAADDANVLEFLALDRRFHLVLIDALDNHRLSRLVGELRDHTHLPGLRRLAQDKLLNQSGREHLELLEALEAGDPTLAAAIMRRHIGRTRGEWA